MSGSQRRLADRQFARFSLGLSVPRIFPRLNSASIWPTHVTPGCRRSCRDPIGFSKVSLTYHCFCLSVTQFLELPLASNLILTNVSIFSLKQCIGLLRKMPYSVHLDDLIAFLERFHQLDTAPCPLYGSFGIGMGRRGLVTGIGARSAESEHQLVLSMGR